MNEVHVIKTFGTYFQNDKLSPLCYGEVEIENTARRRLRTEPEKNGVLCETVFAGFCGTDFELMKMSVKTNLTKNFLPAKND